MSKNTAYIAYWTPFNLV